MTTKPPPLRGLPYFFIAACAAVWVPGLQAATTLQITNLSRAANSWAIGWPPQDPGTVYTVQFQDTLQDGIWRLPPSDVPFPVATNIWVSPGTTNTTGFYRVAGVPAAQRGKLLSATPAGMLSTAFLAFIFSQAGISLTPQYNVREYKVVYETITALGARTIASGALLLPENPGRALPFVSYQHGTITQTNAAPSSMDLYSEVTIGIAFASNGYAAAVPDYLGLGASPGLHPYHHARSEATACIDMLRAARTVCANNGVALTNRLFLCGYSQGGHATMALLREMETYHTNEFAVAACAPMAGAYDLSGVTTDDFLSGRAEPNPYYFLYLLAAYEEVYSFAPSLADLLAAPYSTTLPPLIYGNASGSQINAAMPADPTQILKPEYLAAFRVNPRHPLRLALVDNDLYRWTPRAPLRLYHCAADRDVVIANSEVAYASFQALGATQVQLIDPLPTADHGGCAQPSLLSAKVWFDSLR
ncbi:MAG TPA: lipase family protein [Verrucomicrobiae bacterium]